MNNRIVVHCTNTLDVILTQTKKRNKKRNVVKSDEERIHYIKEKLELKTKMMAVLKQHNIPVLEINTSDNIDDNVKKINAFIEMFENNLEQKDGLNNKC